MSSDKEEKKLEKEAAQNELALSDLGELPKSRLISAKTEETVYAGASVATGADYTFHYWNIAFSALSILLRSTAVFFNVRLAFEFFQRGDTNYFAWTVICITFPLFITSMIQCYMCYEDGKFRNGFVSTLCTCCLVLFSSIFMRDWNTLVYSIRCKQAELKGDSQLRLRYYKLTIREESDMAFIRLFECFLESAPQKILQMSIVLRQDYEISYLQGIVICMHFGSMAWCLAAYNRYVRCAQADKYDMNSQGLTCQFFWHFCISISRTLCLAFVASLFPFWTIIGYSSRALLFGVLIFIFDRPKSPADVIVNLFFCSVFGIIYIFTYISTRDEPTRKKYVLYYTTCFLENLCCIALFVHFATPAMASSEICFILLCSSAFFFYLIGIISGVLYYVYLHPRITARTSSGPSCSKQQTKN